jgi:CBS domain-containing protein
MSNQMPPVPSTAGGSPSHVSFFLECTAEEYMTRAVSTVTRQTTMRELETLFEKHDFNSFPVVEKGKVSGIVTKFDFLRAFAFTIGQMVPHYDELMRRTRLGQGRETERSEVGVGKPDREGFAPGDVPGATAAGSRISQLP